ncbi:MAG: DUF3373 family protein [Thermodesulfobacteriota bacterium]|nr:DUF3373 family protein [Thermodesulfobacteriota bacterium]
MLKRCLRCFLVACTVCIFIIPFSAIAASDENLGLMREDIDEISNRLDKVETKSILDRVIIGGEFRTRLDYLRYEDTTDSLDSTTPAPEHDANTEDLWSNRLRLNLKANITDDLIFQGRLSVFKLWGESNYYKPSFDLTYPSRPDSEGKVHLERAYIEYFIPDSHLALSVGRLPTNEGPPNEFRDNTTRKANYPRLFIDGESDGIVANISLDEWTDLKNSALRLHYMKFIQNALQDKGVDADDSRVGIVSFESEVPNIKNSFMWIGFLKIFDLPTVESFGSDSTISSLSGLLPITSTPKDGGHGELYSIHLQFDDINESGLDCFASFALISIHPRSRGTVFGGGIYEAGIFGDNINGNLGDDQDGTCTYLGLRYTISSDAFNDPKVGFEYSHGSKYWMGLLSNGSGDLINKLNIGGDAYEIYYIQPIIEKHMFCRLGGVYMDYDYDISVPVGSIPDSDMTIFNGYLLMDVRF